MLHLSNTQGLTHGDAPCHCVSLEMLSVFTCSPMGASASKRWRRRVNTAHVDSTAHSECTWLRAAIEIWVVACVQCSIRSLSSILWIQFFFLTTNGSGSTVIQGASSRLLGAFTSQCPLKVKMWWCASRNWCFLTGESLRHLWDNGQRQSQFLERNGKPAYIIHTNIPVPAISSHAAISRSKNSS